MDTAQLKAHADRAEKRYREAPSDLRKAHAVLALETWLNHLGPAEIDEAIEIAKRKERLLESVAPAS